MITIGVSGFEKKPGIIGMLRKMITKSGLRFNIIETYDFYSSTLPNISLKEYLDELKKNKTDIVILKILDDQLRTQIYKNIRFNILVHNNMDKSNYVASHEKWIEDQKQLFTSMTSEDIAIINIDDHTVLELLNGSKMCVITYGLSSKATITASSIEQDLDSSTFTYCVQRSISTLEKERIEPQEFPVKLITNQEKNIYDILAAVTTALICNVSVSKIRQIIL